MAFAEQFALPCEVELGTVFPRRNEFGGSFLLRWARLRFEVFWGSETNVKVILKVWRPGGVCEHFLVETDPYDVEWNRHRRHTRDCFLHPYCDLLGPTTAVNFSYIVHHQGRSIPSEHDYLLVDGPRLGDGEPLRAPHDRRPVGHSTYRTCEVDPAPLQRDVDWYNRHFESLRLTPKFTKGTPAHPYHPKRYLHERIDETIREHLAHPGGPGIKVCVDCIDDTDFINHLLHAHACGVDIQIILNGHMARRGDPGQSRNMDEEIRRPLIPAVARLVHGGIPVALAYGQTDQQVPYCLLHSKYCVIDDSVVLDGSFNWYNTSVLSHDLLVVANNPELARAYLHEFGQILRLFRFPSGCNGPFGAPAAVLHA